MNDTMTFCGNETNLSEVTLLKPPISATVPAEPETDAQTETDGGTYIHGNSDTVGGDFVDRDKVDGGKIEVQMGKC